MRRPVLFMLLVLLSGCTLDSVRSKPLGAQGAKGGNPNVGAPSTLTYNPSLNVDLSMMVETASGLYWRDITPGDGMEVVQGSTASVEYTGWLADGSKFDSNKGTGRPFSFRVGTRQVIDGWDEGVIGMRVGGTRMLVIPPELGYGKRGMGRDIPGGATLVFVVELLGVQGGR